MRINLLKMYKLIFFVPESHLDKTKKSLFKIGCGVQGNYENCAWEVKGKGQFLPREDSKPYIGSENVLTFVDEYRVEMLCPKNLKDRAANTLIKSHPYETPAFEFITVEN